MSSKWMIQDWTTGELNALVKNLGGEKVARKIQGGEVKVSSEDVADVAKVFFDKHGRRIPEGLQANVCDANKDFRLDQPELKVDASYIKRIQLLHESLGIDTGITSKQLREKCQRLRKMIADMPQTANILKGVNLPVVLVKRYSDDIGEDLEWQLDGVERSYLETFPDRKFYNHRKSTLAGQVKVIPEVFKEGGYKSIWGKKKSEHIIALFFPNPLQGYSIFAQREQMVSLSEFGFILSGAIEPMTMYPDILARDWDTPGLDLPALFISSWRSAGSFYFRAGRDGLVLSSTARLADALGSYSGGLLFLG
tara:strand:- start:10251 stop:11177 length:927 start_codon:yes stop_codon:yes gene_type:complete